jgi:hypothetical protein
VAGLRLCNDWLQFRVFRLFRGLVFAIELVGSQSFCMSTLAEIQEGITRLPEEERRVLSAWLDSQNPRALSPQDEDELLCSLDEALRDLDNGKGIPVGLMSDFRGCCERPVWRSEVPS